MHVLIVLYYRVMGLLPISLSRRRDMLISGKISLLFPSPNEYVKDGEWLLYVKIRENK